MSRSRPSTAVSRPVAIPTRPSTSTSVMSGYNRITPPRSLHTSPGPQFDSPTLPTLNPSSTPATPSAPRKLPTTSPPSARLRRLAPAPVKIPPTPPFPASARVGTYKHWATESPVGGGKRKGSAPALHTGAEGNTGAAGEDTVEDDPFDLEFQFASPPTRSPARQDWETMFPFDPLAANEHTAKMTRSPHNADPFAHIESYRPSGSSSPLKIPGRPSFNRQDSSTTYRTDSTLPSFSTSPVLHSAKACPSTYAAYIHRNGPGFPRPTPHRGSSGREAPDVPDEILDDFSGGPWEAGSGSRHSTEWSDEDARAPSRRTGDELLSPGAFLAAHVPRPVLVQFRDVFGANDTTAPHLPASMQSPGLPLSPYPPHRQPSPPPPTPLTALPVAPDETEPRQSRGSLAASLSTFGVHGQDGGRRAREKSNGSENGSFTFSAYLADDDPVRESLTQLNEMSAGLSRVKSSRPVPRPDNRTPKLGSSSSRSHGARQLSPVKAIQSGHTRLQGKTGKNQEDSDLFTSEMAIRMMAGEPIEQVLNHRDSKWAHPFARSATDSPGSEEEDELVTPEQRDMGGTSQNQSKLDGDEHFSTPTPRSRDPGMGEGIGLGLKLNDTSYRPPYARDFMTNFFGDRSQQNDEDKVEKVKVPKMMKEDYERAGGSDFWGGHVSNLNEPSKAEIRGGPKKFKSLASLRKRLPSSRGGEKPPVLPVPAPMMAASRSREAVLPPMPVTASLTGKEPSARPTTSRSKPAATSAVSALKGKNPIPPIGESFLNFHEGDTPPPTGTSVAFSVNSFETTANGATAKEPEWKGSLREDITVDGVFMPKDMTLNLWVDQENCREVISTLHPIRWHPPTRTRIRALDKIDEILTEKKTYDFLDERMDDSHTEGNVFWAEGCLEFGMNPRKRAKWAFTYGALEAFPSLRRVTMDGKQNYDFTSRIATLRHRVRGIYAVSGEEKCGARWRFRYLVDIPMHNDGRARTIIPMSFYVNTAFLRGDHAQKLGFSNMIGKALRSNLQSEKIPTPELISASQVGSTASLGRGASGGAAGGINDDIPVITQELKSPTEEISTFEPAKGIETPRQPQIRQYQVSSDDAGGRHGEMTPLLPRPVAVVRQTPRPSTAQEPRTHTPLTSLRPGTSTSTDKAPVCLSRARPGTAAAAFPPLAILDKNRVAPFLMNEPPTPPAVTSAKRATFGRSRALTASATRPITPLSAPLSTVLEKTEPVLTPVSGQSAFAAGLMKAKKSLSNLRPPSRPGTAGLTISKPFDVHVSQSVSADITRLRTKSSNHAIGKNDRPSTSTGHPALPAISSTVSSGSGSGSVSTSGSKRSFGPFSSRSSRPSTANPVPSTPHRPPTAPNASSGLHYGFGSYTKTPPNGITYSALAMQQLEARTSPETFRREVYGDIFGRSTGRAGRRPNTADPRSRVSGSMI